MISVRPAGRVSVCDKNFNVAIFSDTVNICNWVNYLIMLNAMKAVGRTGRGSWPSVQLCVLAFYVMCCVWEK